LKTWVMILFLAAMGLAFPPLAKAEKTTGSGKGQDGVEAIIADRTWDFSAYLSAFLDSGRKPGSFNEA